MGRGVILSPTSLGHPATQRVPMAGVPGSITSPTSICRRRINMKNAVPMYLLCLSALITALPAGAAEPGAIQLSLDLTDAPRQVFHARESIPVKPGALTIYYPKWIPGEHSPSGPLENLTGVKFSAGGKPVSWRRDPENMYAFLLQIPAGVDTLDVSFDFLSPSAGGEFGQSVSATPDIV